MVTPADSYDNLRVVSRRYGCNLVVSKDLTVTVNGQGSVYDYSVPFALKAQVTLSMERQESAYPNEIDSYTSNVGNLLPLVCQNYMITTLW